MTSRTAIDQIFGEEGLEYIHESTNTPIVVGSVEDDGTIQMAVGKGEDFGHDDAFPEGWNLDMAWRFRPDTGTLYWWHEWPSFQARDLVKEHLRAKGYRVRNQTVLYTHDDDLNPRKWMRAHGEF